MTNDNSLINTLTDWLSAEGLSTDYQLQALAGGDINETALLITARGHRFCVKQNNQAPPDFFTAEAEGLRAIAASNTLRVPEVVFVAEQFIVLEYIAPRKRNANYWRMLGEGLAQLHSVVRPQFGFSMDNYCGLTPQPNPLIDDGHEFFRDQRILYQARMAFDRGLLNKQELKTIERFTARLSNLIPQQPAVLIHGDLWSGNIHSDENGDPVLIDPAAYQGWAEADIAMTLLFGGFADAFYHSYQAVNPLESGWREKADIYNVYHLLNHLNLFGGGYHAQVMAIVKRYSG
ncbi:MAG: fructosamine kinase family protein [Cellvibrionaceae bacterium]